MMTQDFNLSAAHITSTWGICDTGAGKIKEEKNNTMLIIESVSIGVYIFDNRRLHDMDCTIFQELDPSV